MELRGWNYEGRKITDKLHGQMMSMIEFLNDEQQTAGKDWIGLQNDLSDRLGIAPGQVRTIKRMMEQLGILKKGALSGRNVPDRREIYSENGDILIKLLEVEKLMQEDTAVGREELIKRIRSVYRLYYQRVLVSYTCREGKAVFHPLPITLKALKKYGHLDYWEWYLLNTLVRGDDNARQEAEFHRCITEYREGALCFEDGDLKKNKLSHVYILGNFEYAGFLTVKGSKEDMKITLNKEAKEEKELIDQQIDAKLKKIMEERNIHNDTMSGDGDQSAQDLKGRTMLPERAPRSVKLHPLNQIIYGAPGTGKTYSTVEYAAAILENRKVNESRQSAPDRQALMKRYEKYIAGGQIVFTTFHQSYGYEEFVQGIRPEPLKEGLSFRVSDGIFKKIADEAMKDNENNYVIIIDEINRGNISKIFGELITLIEEDKRWGELNQMAAVLPLGGSFAVPNNLYIIGTMNSADKSILMIDTALRRRFDFVEMAPDPEMISDGILRSTLKKLNTYLRRELRSTDLLIGHSYFMGKREEDLGEIMNRNIIPLLYEYFYDDEAKVRRALECISGTGFEINGNAPGRIRLKKKDSE